MSQNWVLEALGAERYAEGQAFVQHRLVQGALGEGPTASGTNREQEFISDALQFAVFEALAVEQPDLDEVRTLASRAFDMMRASYPAEANPGANPALLLTACHGILGDRGPDVHRFLMLCNLDQPREEADWRVYVRNVIWNAWTRLIRKSGWHDLDRLESQILALRHLQGEYERNFFDGLEEDARAAAWELIAEYHLARAAEILATYTVQGEVEGKFDIREQLQSQFDRSILACERAELVELLSLAKILQATSDRLVANSIWTITRASSSRVARFVTTLVDRDRLRPVFEVLPPQRMALREQGLLGSGARSIVVSLPTSSGKTMIAQFRILQALNQFDEARGWVAYIAPTRALVAQVASRLRHDFKPLGIGVERVSPALEVDLVETSLLTSSAPDAFRVLVCTPEKLDLLLRGGWETKIGRPLTLVVVDEAHNLSAGARGLRLELLLATINRECRNSQFLLLTPFVPNAQEIARWLSPDSAVDVSVGFNWQPNERLIGLVRASKGERGGTYSVCLKTLQTSKETIDVPGTIELASGNPLGLKWAQGKGLDCIAAVTADVLAKRGSVIVVGRTVPSAWSIARRILTGSTHDCSGDPDIQLVSRFVADEFGEDFELREMLHRGIGLHHAGLSQETLTLMEWLTEVGKLRQLVATTTIAQGLNFPVSAIVLSSVKYPYGVEMTSDEFWNLAGRAGRADQSKLGIIALAAGSDEAEADFKQYVKKATHDLNSTLLNMVTEVLKVGDNLDLTTLFHKKEWSSFLQYIAHSYRLAGDHEAFSSQVEQVLRGCLGFQHLRRSYPLAANALVAAVRRYANVIRNKPLKLVDSTGFCWESVSIAMKGVQEARITESTWDPEAIFDPGNDRLKQVFGVLFKVPELREDLKDATAGRGHDGDLLARIVKDWVKGATISDIAKEHFATEGDSTDAVTKACQSVYGKLIQTASWGLSALQTLTLGPEFGDSQDERWRSIRNLPARIYYGVDDDRAVAARLAGVPRGAAGRIAHEMVTPTNTISDVRSVLEADDGTLWSKAMGKRGGDYRRIWQVLEGGR